MRDLKEEPWFQQWLDLGWKLRKEWELANPEKARAEAEAARKRLEEEQ